MLKKRPFTKGYRDEPPGAPGEREKLFILRRLKPYPTAQGPETSLDGRRRRFLFGHLEHPGEI
jgi:hypothetical protein